MLPGSHKASYLRPDSLFGAFSQDSRVSGTSGANVGIFDDPMRHELPQELQELGMRSLCPRAGDALLLPEATTHCVLPWAPTDRPRRTLMLRYQPQHRGEIMTSAWPESIERRLAPETRELLEAAHVNAIKEVAKLARVTLSEPGSNIARL